MSAEEAEAESVVTDDRSSGGGGGGDGAVTLHRPVNDPWRPETGVPARS